MLVSLGCLKDSFFMLLSSNMLILVFFLRTVPGVHFCVAKKRCIRYNYWCVG